MPKARTSPFSDTEIAEHLSVFLSDFRWLLAEHPEHNGRYADARSADIEAIITQLRGEARMRPGLGGPSA